MRASQINGCAYCLDMHSKDARAKGETEQRLYGLDAWRETPYYSARERAALEWTEALTLVSETRVPDDVYERVREQFSEDELVHLSLAIVAINGWNRLNVAARTVPGPTLRAASRRCTRRSDRPEFAASPPGYPRRTTASPQRSSWAEQAQSWLYSCGHAGCPEPRRILPPSLSPRDAA